MFTWCEWGIRIGFKPVSVQPTNRTKTLNEGERNLVLRRWGSEIKRFCFIFWIDRVRLAMVRRWRLDCGSCVVYIREVWAMLLLGTWYHGNQEQISWTKSLRWFDDECCSLCLLCKTSSTLLLTVALLRLRKTSLPFHSSFNPSRKQLHNKMF